MAGDVEGLTFGTPGFAFRLGGGEGGSNCARVARRIEGMREVATILIAEAEVNLPTRFLIVESS